MQCETAHETRVFLGTNLVSVVIVVLAILPDDCILTSGSRWTAFSERGHTRRSLAQRLGEASDGSQDHPIEYASFEGTEGEYGAGAEIVWDRGEWVHIGDAATGNPDGKLKFQLVGEKLHGAWAMVRMRREPEDRTENWLLIKKRHNTTVTGHSRRTNIVNHSLRGRFAIREGLSSCACVRAAAVGPKIGQPSGDLFKNC